MRKVRRSIKLLRGERPFLENFHKRSVTLVDDSLSLGLTMLILAESVKKAEAVLIEAISVMEDAQITCARRRAAFCVK